MRYLIPLIILLFSFNVNAQGVGLVPGNCLPIFVIEQALKDSEYVPRTMGLGIDGKVYNTYTREDGDWYTVRREPDGIGCVMAVGKAFMDFHNTDPGY